ncbi:hypothetical protein DF185_08145 [Marinifilum breve]|uniref:Uncharacterized protein n=1 Tax=Marinifilum breve TaxID=2184082 RepID=A0A2V3ZYP5_9BACT|nr:hypothetical protein [Marinifilum breve]PXY01446.1 hypothetical protein DF185_08145 [Marinifilum breve]
MDVKILKVLTVLAYVFITWTGTHLGGTFGYYIIFGLMDIHSVLFSALFLLILISFLYSAFKPIKKYDWHVFLLGGIVLCVPIFYHTHVVLSEFKNRGDHVFFLTACPFLIIYGITVFRIKRSAKAENKFKSL